MKSSVTPVHYVTLSQILVCINQGVPGTAGLKGDRGDSGPPVRPDIIFSSLLASMIPHHALFIILSHLLHLFSSVFLSSFLK